MEARIISGMRAWKYRAKTRDLMFFYYRYLMKNKLIGLDIRGQKVQLGKKLRIKFLLFSIIYIWLSSPGGSCQVILDQNWVAMRNSISWEEGTGGMMKSLTY